MTTRYALYDSSGKLVLSSLNKDDENILNYCNSNSIMKDPKCRAGKVQLDIGSISIISYDKDLIASSKKFKSVAITILNSMEYVVVEINKARKKISEDNKKVLHNIVSISAHITQDIYSIFNIELLSSDTKRSLDTIKETLKRNNDSSAKMIFSLIKYSESIRDELLAIDSLFSESSNNLNPMQHNIHKVLMKVLYRFHGEFNDKKITYNLDRSDITGYFDYATVSSALYHIIGNAAKYTEHRTKIEINIFSNEACVFISMTAFSIVINKDDINRIFEDGYSGVVPKQLHKAGNGVGMFVANKFIRANNGKLSVIPNIGETHDVVGIKYQENKFTIEVPRSNSGM